MISRRSGPAVTATDRKSAPLGACPVCGAKLRNPSRFRRRSPVFFASAHGGSLCSVAFFPSRLVRSKSCVFSVSAPQFFRRSPALFSFGGRVALLRGVKCAVPRARVSRTRQPLFVFSLHRFTHPTQRADNLYIVGEGLAFPSSRRSSLPHGGRRCERQAQRARREIGQFLLTHRRSRG